MKRAIVLVVLLAGGAGLAVMTRGTFVPKSAPQKAGEAKPGTQWVGVASGQTPTTYVDTGPVDYTYVPNGWSYTGTRKDW